MTKPRVLQVGPLPQTAIELLDRHFVLESGHEGEAGGTIEGIATNGKIPIDRHLLDRLPRLRIVSCLGAGTDGLDVEDLERRGIAVATTSRVLANDVADVAIGLVIALARDFRGADRFVREGRWSGGRYALGFALAETPLGILGLGTIGRAVERRAEALGMKIGYHNRNPRRDTAAHYFAELSELARWSRFLVVCCPGGPATHHLVDKEILEALGPDGWLVNVSRGSVVSEEALLSALEAGKLAGAGLDVFENEPTPLPGLTARDDVILLPHIGSATGQTREAMAAAMVDALVRALVH